MLNYIVLGFLVVIAVYGYMVLNIYSRRLKFDIDKAVKEEIEMVANDAVCYAEEMAHMAKTQGEEFMTGASKLQAALDMVLERFPAKPETVKKLILAKLNEGRYWMGNKIIEAGEEIKD